MEPILPVRLEIIKQEVEQAGREIFYAISFLPVNHPSRANLESALKYIGVLNPKQVGLSDSVLTRNNPKKNAIPSNRPESNRTS
jgi:hypothetical protein